MLETLKTNNEVEKEKLELTQKQINALIACSTKKTSIDNICSFVIQDIASQSKNIVFDLCEDQLYNLHFKNGVYELNNKKFRPRTQSDYITQFLDWDYNENVNDDIYNELDLFFSKLQPQADQKKFLLEWMAYNLSGSTSSQKFLMNIGYSASNGKSTLFKIHDLIFDIYSFKLDSKTFNMNNDKRHKQLIHLIKNPIRFSYCEELKEEKLDVDFIKDYVDGSKINVEIMYGTSEAKSIQAKLTTCSNKDFNIAIDKGILRRGIVQFYESQFKKGIVDNYETNEYTRIDGYEKIFNNEQYKNAYLKLLINHYKTDIVPPNLNENFFKEIANEYYYGKTG